MDMIKGMNEAIEKIEKAENQGDSSEYSRVLQMMKDLSQPDIVSRMESAPAAEKEAFLKQVAHLEKVWPGGIKGYIERAKVLLEDSKNGKNPLEEYTPSVPEGFNVKVGDDNFYELEKLGFEEIKDTCFVLVAGGLGERLGYNDIKIGIQSNLVTLDRFIQVYINYILAYEAKFKKEKNLCEDWYIPLAIMTSGDTHDKTVKLLNNNYNFGMKPFQITIVKQEKCPAMLDNDCHLSLKPDHLEI
jgi:UDP-sugar pyrophosphorylase